MDYSTPLLTDSFISLFKCESSDIWQFFIEFILDLSFSSSFLTMTDTYVWKCSRHFRFIAFDFSAKKVNTGAAAKTTTAASKTKKAVQKVPEVLLKKRKLYADLKARRLRAQLQATKVDGELFALSQFWSWYSSM